MAKKNPATAGKGKGKGQENKVEENAGQANSDVASSGSSAAPAAQETNGPMGDDIVETIKLVRSKAKRKTNRLVIFNIEGRTGSVQFLSTLFGGTKDSVGNVPETLELTGDFAPARVAKEKETKEQRKARLALLPKLTPAQKIEKAKERLAKLEDKMAKAEAKKIADAAAANAAPAQ